MSLSLNQSFDTNSTASTLTLSTGQGPQSAILHWTQYLPNPHPHPSCPWWPVVDMVGAADTTLCERVLCEFVVHPANTWSNLAFVLSSALMYWDICRTLPEKKGNGDNGEEEEEVPAGTVPRKVLLLFPVFNLICAMCSIFYHTSLAYPFQAMDYIGILAYQAVNFKVNVCRLSSLSQLELRLRGTAGDPNGRSARKNSPSKRCSSSTSISSSPTPSSLLSAGLLDSGRVLDEIRYTFGRFIGLAAPMVTVKSILSFISLVVILDIPFIHFLYTSNPPHDDETTSIGGDRPLIRLKPETPIILTLLTIVVQDVLLCRPLEHTFWGSIVQRKPKSKVPSHHQVAEAPEDGESMFYQQQETRGDHKTERTTTRRSTTPAASRRSNDHHSSRISTMTTVEKNSTRIERNEQLNSCRKKPPHYKYLIAALLWIAVAKAFAALDSHASICDPDNHWFQGHAAWHVVGGVGLYCLFRHLLLRGEGYGEKHVERKEKAVCATSPGSESFDRNRTMTSSCQRSASSRRRNPSTLIL